LEHLKGIKVLSFNHFFMGPVGVQFLADLGADVIAVESPEGAFQRKWGGANKRLGGQTMLMLAGNRNKRSLAVDLKHPDGLAIVKKLLATTDVMTENFRPGVLDRRGLGYDSVRAIKADIIYAAASGFGPDGPYVNRPGQDLIIQAMSGLTEITGTRKQGPRAVGVSAIDHHGASLLAGGIMAALIGRMRTGEGCRIDVSLLASAIDLQLESFTSYLNGSTPDDVRQPDTVAGWYYGAPYGVYAVRDGHVAISLSPLSQVYAAIEVPQAERVPDAENFTRREEAGAAIERRLAVMTMAEATAALEKAGIWHSRCNSYAEVVADPQVRHMGAFTSLPGAGGADITLVNHPIRYDGKPPAIRMAPQPLGAQTASILEEIGYGPGDISALEQRGVVRTGGPMEAEAGSGETTL